MSHRQQVMVVLGGALALCLGVLVVTGARVLRDPGPLAGPAALAGPASPAPTRFPASAVTVDGALARPRASRPTVASCRSAFRAWQAAYRRAGGAWGETYPVARYERRTLAACPDPAHWEQLAANEAAFGGNWSVFQPGVDLAGVRLTACRRPDAALAPACRDLDDP